MRGVAKKARGRVVIDKACAIGWSDGASPMRSDCCLRNCRWRAQSDIAGRVSFFIIFTFIERNAKLQYKMPFGIRHHLNVLRKRIFKPRSVGSLLCVLLCNGAAGFVLNSVACAVFHFSMQCFYHIQLIHMDSVLILAAKVT